MSNIGPNNAPVPRRTSRPKWLDIRIIGGLLLIIAAVVVGARVVGASSHTSPVWAASKNLASGTVLTAADLVPVEVNLADGAVHYLAADAGAAPAVGSSLVIPVQAGELLPVSAVQQVRASRIVVVGVSPDRMAPGVGHGSLIDLYLTSGGGASSSEPKTILVSGKITVQSVAAPAAGGLSGATSSRYQVAVLVPEAGADALVKTLPKGDAVVVLVTGVK